MAEEVPDLSPEQFKEYSDDEMKRVRLSYEGYVVPFFLVVLWLVMIVGLTWYVIKYAIPDAILWLGQ